MVNQTWKYVRRPRDVELIDSKWIFKLKYNEDGKIDKYKARLCARGFKQVHGVNYDETFSPVVRYDSLRYLLALAA